jgi:hypothetical protein
MYLFPQFFMQAAHTTASVNDSLAVALATKSLKKEGCDFLPQL